MNCLDWEVVLRLRQNEVLSILPDDIDTRFPLDVSECSPDELNQVIMWYKLLSSVYNPLLDETRSKFPRFTALRQQTWFKIAMVKPFVSTYYHDSSLPELPSDPAGALYRIGFIYDEDCDNRVLIAIDERLRHHKEIIAVAEHKGEIEIYARQLPFLSEIEVCDDYWYPRFYLPSNGRWVEAHETFVRQCVAYVLGSSLKPSF